MTAVLSTATDHNYTSFKVNKPAGTSAGDLLMAMIVLGGVADSTAPQSPADWTDFSRPDPAGVPLSVMLSFKFAGASEPASYTFGDASGNASDYRVTIARITGIDNQANWYSVFPQWNITASTSASGFTAPSISVPDGGGLKLTFLARYGTGDTPTLSPPSSFDSPDNLARSPFNVAWAANQYNSAYTNTATWHRSTGGDQSQIAYAVGAMVLGAGSNLIFGGSVTASGVSVKSTVKYLTGSSTAVGTLPQAMKVVVRVLTGSVSAAGAVLNATVRVFSGSITPAGSRIKVPLKVLGHGITASGVSVRRPRKILTGSVTAASTTLIAQIGRIFGRPGTVAIALALAGEVRARLRRG